MMRDGILVGGKRRCRGRVKQAGACSLSGNGRGITLREQGQIGSH